MSYQHAEHPVQLPARRSASLWRTRLLDRWKVWLLLAPALIVILILFVGSAVFAVGESLGYMPVLGLDDFNIRAYKKVLSSGEFWEGALTSLYIAFTSTVLATIGAVICAVVLRELSLGKRFISFLFQLSLSIPHMVTAIAVLLLTAQSGLLARFAYLFGFINEPAHFPELVFDRYSIGIILTYVLKEVPFIGIIVLAILQSVGREHEDAAATLGAGRWQRFRYVTLPLIMPGTLSAFIIVFAYIFGAFEIPYLLGRTDPTALPVLGFRYYLDIDLNARAEAMAINVLMLLFVLVLIAIYSKISRTTVRD
jgi:putative spermidine/putrescine transport system permease protein